MGTHKPHNYIFSFVLIASFYLSISVSYGQVAPCPGQTNGCIDRASHLSEFDGNDALIEDICGLTKVEVGFQNPLCSQMFMESVMNRATAIGTTTHSRMHDTPYWGRGAARDPYSASEFQTCKRALTCALNGSNLSNYATDNASAGVAANRKAAGNPGVDCNYGSGNEFFYINKNGSGSGGVPAHGAWATQAQASASSASCTSQPIDGGDPNGSDGNSGDDSNDDSDDNSTGDQPSDPSDDTSESGPSCSGGCPACAYCPRNINRNHQRIRYHVISEFEQHRNWLVTTYFLETIAPAMMLMTEQLVTTGMLQVKIIGNFFDAKHQLETQRLFQQMTAQAHKDYHPSESMCKIGTNMRSLAASEKRNALVHEGLAQGMMQRQVLNSENLSGAGGHITDRRSRGRLLIQKFCHKNDAGIDKEGTTALNELCENNGGPQTNMDVDFINAIENNLTLKLNYTDDGGGPATPDEENIFALGANLFGHKVLPYISRTKLEKVSSVNDYVNLRSIAAKRSIAQNSFSAITAMRSEGDKEVAPFLKAILKEAGIEPDDIETHLGEKPSYFAQMEVLTKEIYQNPNFYSNLYDKPANIERKSAALLAIEIMQDRDMYKSLLRSEAVLATLVEVMLSKEHQRVTGDLAPVTVQGDTVKSNGGGS